MALLPANPNAAVGGLRDSRAIVDRAALDGGLHHSAVAGADRDHQIGFLPVQHRLQPAPFHQSLLDIIASGGIAMGWSSGSPASGSTTTSTSVARKTSSGRADLFLFFAIAEWPAVRQKRTSEQRRAVMGASVT